MTDNIETIKAEYERFKQQNLNLNMKRGQPSDADFDLSLPLLTCIDNEDYITDSGIDVRNYPGGVKGLPEAREMFSELLGVKAEELIVGNNSSLDLMGTVLQWALLRGVQNSPQRWVDVAPAPKMVVTVPGYDRHFKLLHGLGFELCTIAMTAEGPDIDALEQLVSQDATIKGIFFVPVYSNPTGDTISMRVAKRLVAIDALAPDFTIFADNAYAVHHLVDDPDPAPNLLRLAEEAGSADRVILFGSTSKITFAGGGLGFIGMSAANVDYFSSLFGLHTIGPNKVEQWRHVQFLRRYPGGLYGLMRDHAKIIKPKFDSVQQVLSQELNDDLAQWSEPQGGYFVSVDTQRPIADRVVELANDAGVALTPAGATYPQGRDPGNRNIRLAPTRPPAAEVEQAMRVVACCIKLASAEYDASQDA